jgi:hypothetical protein
VSHWAFVAAAYAVAVLGTAALLAASLVAMRRAEAAAADLRAER